MYIKRVYLENVRCFDKFEIDFEDQGSSILILGDNGDGKSTILKSIAMGLCDDTSASALFREMQGEFVQRDKSIDEAKLGSKAIIEIDLTSGGGVVYRIETIITSLKAFERVDQKRFRLRGKEKKELQESDFPWDKIFVCGYGPGLRTQGNADIQHYLSVDAIYPLFKYDARLQNPELGIRRIIDAVRGEYSTPKAKDDNSRKLLDVIKQLLSVLLDLEDAKQINLTPTGIKVEGHWGKAELGEMGDGYQATVTWVIDFISWWFLDLVAKDNLSLLKRKTFGDIKGIVLIDEIEQHLHPKWQRTVLHKLQQSFPGVQFISTTHSPLVASGSSEIKVHILRAGGHKIVTPYGWLAEDVYSIMGLTGSSRAPEYENKILGKYEDLLSKRLDGTIKKQDMSELKKLKTELAKLPESDPVSLTSEIAMITKKLRKLK